MNRLRKDERGVTLLELVVALPIAAMIVIAASGAIFQMLNSGSASNNMLAYREVQTAGYLVSHDALQAREVMLDDPDTPAITEFLTLSWTNWDGDEYRIAYTLEDMASANLKYLRRQETICDKDGNVEKDEPTGPVPQYIYVDSDPTQPTNCVWDEGEKVLTFTVKAQMGLETATRTYEIKPRPFA